VNWLKRYVSSVKHYLPNKLKNDVADELYSDLQDQCDDKSAELGRDLTDQEYHQILLNRGHPMSVAASYQPHSTLVSEELFPIYLQVLKWVIFTLLIVQIVTAITGLTYKTDPNYIRAAIQIISGTFNSGLMGFASVTLVFYLLGESINRKEILKNWHPKKLPTFTDSGEEISIFESSIELVFQLLFLGFINNIFALLNLKMGIVTFQASEQLHAMLPWINLALILGVIFSLYKILAPYWTKRLIVTNWLVYAVSYMVLVGLYQADPVIALEIINTEGIATMYDLPTHWWTNFLFVIGIVFAIDIGFYIRKYMRLN